MQETFGSGGLPAAEAAHHNSDRGAAGAQRHRPGPSATGRGGGIAGPAAPPRGRAPSGNGALRRPADAVPRPGERSARLTATAPAPAAGPRGLPRPAGARDTNAVENQAAPF